MPQNRNLPTPLRWVLQTFDNDAIEISPAADGSNDKVDWVRIIPFILVHVMCLGVFIWGWSLVAVAACLLFYAIRIFAITGFYHRYFSHRSYRTSRIAQFVFAVIGNSSAQRGPLWWAAHHRHHHRHSDTEKDVHSPITHGFLWSHMFWITSKSNFLTDTAQVKDLTRFPELRFLDRFDVLVPFLFGAFCFFLGVVLHHFAPSLGTNGMQMLIWGFFVSTVLVFHGTCTINSLAHKMGRVRYDTGDHSRNSFILALITFGEGWHNNHHFYPAATRQGFRWYEIDITYYGLKVLSWFGIIWDLKPVPDHVRENTLSAHDESTSASPEGLHGKLPKALHLQPPPGG